MLMLIRTCAAIVGLAVASSAGANTVNLTGALSLTLTTFNGSPLVSFAEGSATSHAPGNTVTVYGNFECDDSAGYILNCSRFTKQASQGQPGVPSNADVNTAFNHVTTTFSPNYFTLPPAGSTYGVGGSTVASVPTTGTSFYSLQMSTSNSWSTNTAYKYFSETASLFNYTADVSADGLTYTFSAGADSEGYFVDEEFFSTSDGNGNETSFGHERLIANISSAQLKLSVSPQAPQLLSAHDLAYKALAFGKLVGTSDVDAARNAYQYVIRYREQNSITSSDERYRDLEYFFRGIEGGLLLRNVAEWTADVNDLANAFIPWSSPLYVGLKMLGVNTQEGLPGTPPGGVEASLDGWQHAYRGYTIDAAVDDRFGASVAIPAPPPPATPSGAPASPNLPSAIVPLNFLADAAGTMNIFDVTVDDSVRYYFDPPAADRYLLSSAGLTMKGIQIPDDGTGAGYQIVVGGVSYSATLGNYFDFSSLNLSPTEVGILGLAMHASPFVVGLEFANGGSGQLAISELSSLADEIPEPGAIGIFLTAVGLAALRRRAARSNQ